MSQDIQNTIYNFLKKVQENHALEMNYRQAIDLAAVTIGGFIPAIVSKAAYKYQEATNPKMALFHQENCDALAIASMGKLWHEEEYNDTDTITLEDILLQSIYLVFKYKENALSENTKCVGDSDAREVILKMILS